MLRIIGAALIGICLLDVGLFYGTQWFGTPDWSFIPKYDFFVFGDTDYITYVGGALGGFLYAIGSRKNENLQDDDETNLDSENARAEDQSNSYFGLSLDTHSKTLSKRSKLEGRIFFTTLWALIVTGFIFAGGIWSFWDDLIDWNNSWSPYKHYRSENATKSYKGDSDVIVQRWIDLAKRGNVDAQFNLGVAYTKGEGVIKDARNAVKWYRLAAEKEHAGSQNNLGMMHVNGNFLARSKMYAHMWFNIAASSGHENARKNKETIAETMSPREISDAHNLARECVRKKYKGC